MSTPKMAGAIHIVILYMLVAVLGGAVLLLYSKEKERSLVLTTKRIKASHIELNGDQSLVTLDGSGGIYLEKQNHRGNTPSQMVLSFMNGGPYIDLTCETNNNWRSNQSLRIASSNVGAGIDIQCRGLDQDHSRDNLPIRIYQHRTEEGFFPEYNFPEFQNAQFPSIKPSEHNMETNSNKTNGH